MTTPKMKRYVPMKRYVRWLWAQAERDDEVGDLARDAQRDPYFPVRGTAREVRLYWRRFAPQVEWVGIIADYEFRVHFRRRAPKPPKNGPSET